MAKAYSSDLRLRCLNLIERGKLQTEVSSLMNVTVRTLCRWWKLYKMGGITEARLPCFMRGRKVDYELVERFIVKYSDKTLREIVSKFGLSDVGVLKIIRKLNITYKKMLPVRGAKGRFARRVSKDIKENS